MHKAMKTVVAILTGPAVVAGIVGLAVWMFPPSYGNVADFVKPPAANPLPAIPQTLLNVKAGEKVGEEAYWGDFHLNRGWVVGRWDNSTMFNLEAQVTNIGEETKTARVQAKFYAGHQIVGYALCRVTLAPGETKALICADSIARYTPHWNRLTVYSS